MFSPPKKPICLNFRDPHHAHPHALSPRPFGVGDEYSWRNQGGCSPSGLLELMRQVG